MRSPINEEREGVDRNSAADIIGSGPEMSNELIMLRSVQNTPIVTSQVGQKSMTQQ